MRLVFSLRTHNQHGSSKRKMNFLWCVYYCPQPHTFLIYTGETNQSLHYIFKSENAGQCQCHFAILDHRNTSIIIKFIYCMSIYLGKFSLKFPCVRQKKSHAWENTFFDLRTTSQAQNKIVTRLAAVDKSPPISQYLWKFPQKRSHSSGITMFRSVYSCLLNNINRSGRWYVFF